MKVKALKLLGDGKRLYKEGEVFEMTEELCETLNATPNGPLVEEIEDIPEFPKHTGGGYYELSNGEKVKGKEAAMEAQLLIDEK